MSAAAAAATGAPAAPLHRGMITITVMLASIMQALDNTIANVALPHMQGSLSATQDQMTWVLTSYIVAAAIMTPLTGWLADQIGRKRLFVISIVGFTIASALCGLAQSSVADRRVPPAAGPVRRGADAAVASGAARHQSARAAMAARWRSGASGVDARPDPRPDAGRLADRQLQLALGVLHQRALRHPGRAGNPGVLLPESRRAAAPLRPVRLCHAEHRDRQPAAAARPRLAGSTGFRPPRSTCMPSCCAWRCTCSSCIR